MIDLGQPQRHRAPVSVQRPLLGTTVLSATGAGAHLPWCAVGGVSTGS